MLNKIISVAIIIFFVQAMQDQLMRQKRLAMQKLEKRRQKRQDKDYEELAAVALLQNAEKHQEMKEESTQAQKEKQSNLVNKICFLY